MLSWQPHVTQILMPFHFSPSNFLISNLCWPFCVLCAASTLCWELFFSLFVVWWLDGAIFMNVVYIALFTACRHLCGVFSAVFHTPSSMGNTSTVGLRCRTRTEGNFGPWWLWTNPKSMESMQIEGTLGWTFFFVYFHSFYFCRCHCLVEWLYLFVFSLRFWCGLTPTSTHTHTIYAKENCENGSNNLIFKSPVTLAHFCYCST